MSPYAQRNKVLLSNTVVRLASPEQQIAEEVRVLLARRRTSHRQIAEKLGWSPAYLSRRLSGATPLTISDLYSLATVLNVSVQSLLPAETMSTWTSLLQEAAA